VYDGANRLQQHIDALGAVTQYLYDGAGNLLSTRAYANRIDTSGLGTSPGVQTVTTSGADRVTRNFYDTDGQLVGRLDANGALTQYQYDDSGLLAVTVCYASLIQNGWGAATLEELIPESSINDQRSVTLYDAAGRVTGQVDAGGYLTESTYDVDGHVLTTTRYANGVGTSIAAGVSTDSIRPKGDLQDHQTTLTYDPSSGLLSTRKDPNGCTTAYTYWTGTDLVATIETGHGDPSARLIQRRYDPQGRLTQELSGNGSASTEAATQAWTDFGTSYKYDDAGRLLSKTTPSGTTQ